MKTVIGIVLTQLMLWGGCSAWSAADMARMAHVTDLRLVNGRTPYEGRLEVMINSQWGTVCDDLFDMKDAKVVCRHLGYGAPISVKGSAAYGRGTGTIWLDDMACVGTEPTLSDCFHLGPGNHNCGHWEDVGVVCKIPVNNGKIRLVNGATSAEGRVEVYHNGKWGTICDDFWDINDARVVCRELGFPSVVAAKSYAHFGPGLGEIWLDDIHCTGSETNLTKCRHSGWGKHNCVPSEDAGVVCGYGPPVNGGWSSWTSSSCSKTCGNGSMRKHRTCNNPTPKNGGRPCPGNYFTTQHCNLGCCPANGGWTGWISSACSVSCGGGTLKMNRTCTNPTPSCGGRNCAGIPSYVRPCNSQCCPVDGGWGDWAVVRNCTKTCGGGMKLMGRHCGYPRPKCGGHSCDGQSRKLVPCNTHCCKVDGGWTSWRFSECSVSCGGGTKNVTRSCTNPSPSCNGSDCDGDDYRSEKCNMHCCPEQKRAASLVLGATKYEGLVQLTTTDGSAGLICNNEDSWDMTAASILCLQLFRTTARSITSSVGDIVWDGAVVRGNVSCVGDEDCLSMCKINEHTGPCQKFAAVTCNVPEGSVRLADGPTAYSGRVEVYANKTWGSVCDDGWNSQAGNVVCKQFGFSDAEAVYGAARFGTGAGPVLLDDVRCSGTETNLLSCNHNGIGKQNCIPEEAASVTCRCTYQKQKSISRTRRVSYMVTSQYRCWRGYCTRYHVAYKQSTYTTQISVTEPRCCKIDGGWGKWKAGECSVTCGGGVQTLTRACDSPRAFCRGKQCIGPVAVTRHCNTQPCPATFSEWSEYSTCTRTCGGGTQSRNRTCLSGTCRREDLVESRDCNTQCCTVDGGWGEWTNGTCSEPCDGGVLNMTRLCNNPAPSCGGSPCDGVLVQVEEVDCNEEPCNATEPVYGPWIESSPCSATCGVGRQVWSRECLAGPCNMTDMYEVRICATVCCPVNGGWTAFTQVGTCSQTCGEGGVIRTTRTCTNPPPSCGGRDCMGDMEVMINCSQPQCPMPVINSTGNVGDLEDDDETIEDMTSNDTITNSTTNELGSGSGDPNGDLVIPDANPTISAWSNYSMCTATCGGGIQVRTRTCDGMGCDDVDTIETRPCNTNCCPVDGGWSEYTSEGPCSVTCGSGCKSFTRNCTNPPPSCGGKQCDGPTTVIRQCDLKPCAVLPNHDLTPDQIETILGKLNNEQSEQQFMIEVVGDEVGKAIFFKK
ncbi:scavenger receptor cysteine-rich domain superfamily protein-like [Dysidea avara]|uniref:scavenger receptor cysteine-rich domain superfamily protein-like n=1 Tax=Dysidea avara TaxID=196820 RepID=UPI003327DB00